MSESRHSPRTLRRRALALGLLVLGLLALAMVWLFSPWREALEPSQLLPSLQALGQSWGPGLLGLLVCLALVLAVPLGLLTLLTLAALGPLQGTLCILAAGLLAAGFSHSLGHWLGHQALCQLAGPRVQRVSQALARRGLWTVILMRWLPLAPFAIANMVAGASHLRPRDMLLGTLLGMLPGTLFMAFFINHLQQLGDWLRALSGTQWLLGSALLLLLAWLLRRVLRRAWP